MSVRYISDSSPFEHTMVLGCVMGCTRCRNTNEVTRVSGRSGRGLVCLFRGRRSIRSEVGFSRHNEGRSLVIIYITIIISQTPVYVERSKDESTARICVKKEESKTD
jgi:hypothetical protein